MSDDTAALEQALETQPVDTTPTPTIETSTAPDAAPVEPPKVDEPAQSEEDKKFASKFAALARKEKATREKEKQLLEREKQIEARLKEVEAKLAEASAPKQTPKKPLEDRLWENPFEALKEEGLDYETLTRTALNDGQLPPEVQLKRMRIEMERQFNEKIEALKKEREEERTRAAQEAEARAKAEQEETQSRAITQYKQQIGELITSKKEDFSLVAAEGEYGVQAVFDLIAENAQKQRDELGEEAEIEIMSIEEAAKQVEDRLLNKAKDYLKLSKIQGLFGAQNAKPGDKGPNSTETKPQTKAGVTLSNSASQAQGPTKRFLSEEEVLREAARNVKFLAD